jgi:hypothetical protein
MADLRTGWKVLLEGVPEITVSQKRGVTNIRDWP